MSSLRGDVSSPPSKPSAFRFKRPRLPSPYASSSFQPINSRESSSHRHRHHHHRHRSHRPPSPPAHSIPSLDSETAFRESIFDAMADDEGAAFWEGVYGQPVHTYSPYAEAENGELERMTDEEYTAHVRAKMWEKSHAYLAEERKMREERRARRKEEERSEGKREGGRGKKRPRRTKGASQEEEEWKKAGDREVWERMVNEVLARTGPARELEEWRAAWQGYVKGWEVLRERTEVQATQDAKSSSKAARKWKENMIPWPTKSGQMRDVGKDAIEEFLRKAPPEDLDRGKDDKDRFTKVLKVERVRWHPDKIQQRYGALGIDERTLKGVTAVFQIVDRMWGELKGQGTF
ncbi:hypothetical protein MMC26_001620 [Xylographa opegraphella]|nr:hypothetical protein [Xylographa opegraphella]